MTVQKTFTYDPSFPMDYQEYYLSTFSFLRDDPNLLGVYCPTKPSTVEVIRDPYTSATITVRGVPDDSYDYPQPWDTGYCPGTGQGHELRGSECRYCSFDCHNDLCPMTGRNHYMIGDYCHDCVFYSKPIYNLLASYKPNGTPNMGWEVFNAPTYRKTQPKGLSEKVMKAWKEIDERDYRVPTLKGNPEILGCHCLGAVACKWVEQCPCSLRGFECTENCGPPSRPPFTSRHCCYYQPDLMEDVLEHIEESEPDLLMEDVMEHVEESEPEMMCITPPAGPSIWDQWRQITKGDDRCMYKKQRVGSKYCHEVPSSPVSEYDASDESDSSTDSGYSDLL